MDSIDREEQSHVAERGEDEDVIADSDGQQSRKSRKKVMLFGFVKRATLVLLGYLVCYFSWSLALPLITVFTLVWLETQTSYKGKRISSKSKASSMTRRDILKVIDELPSWVTFPDREKAEWLNEIIAQLWPSINSYLVKLFRGKLQTKIRRKFDSFKFEDIDFGETPPKIDSVKVYNRTVTKDSIIIDFEVYYDGNCDINFSMSGAQIGCIKDFQLGAELRIVLKPLMIKTPIIGGIQVFFLNTPDITFELEGISGIPGFSYFIRQKIEDRITKKLVFPNKITKRFSKSVEAVELKALEPEGVLRIHVFEAKDLERKDVTGKSDPYVVLTVGAQENRTHVVKRELNPKWDHWCEFVILDPFGQHLQFKLFDQDELNEDDFLGSGTVDIHTVVREGENDRWFTLDNVKHGKIHLRFTWLGLSSDRNDLYAASQETKSLKVTDISTGLLIVYIDNAEGLMKVKSRKPDPYVIMTVGKRQQKSKVKKHTVDPIWEQGFLMLVSDPDNDSLNLTVIDKNSDTHLGHVSYNVRTLFDHPDLQLSKEEFPLAESGKIVLSLQLRVLKNELFEDDESESDSDVDTPEIRSSFRSSVMSRRSMSSSSNSSSPQKGPQTPVEAANEVIEDIINKTKAPSNITYSPSFRVKPDLGQIEITLHYNDARQKLIVTVHRITNLPLKDPSDIPDPYVKLKLVAPGVHKIKNKTKVVSDNCDPVFEETFEYLLSKSDLPNNKLVITAKTKKIFFNSNAIGQVVVTFKNPYDLLEPQREWYELVEAEDSD